MGNDASHRSPLGVRLRRALGMVAIVVLAASACTTDATSSDGAESTEGADRTSTSASLGAADGSTATPDPSEGCGTPADVDPVGGAAPGDVEQTLDAGGVERTYRLGVPADDDPGRAVPLVVNLHGSGSDALQASLYGDVPKAAAERGMVTVAPEGIEGRWELGGDGADAEFIHAVVDEVEARYCIDRNRVHLIGMSLGAWKAAATACASDRFASVALVTVEVFPGTCDPLPVIAFHGTGDPVAAYGEGGTVDAADTPNEGITGTLDNIANWADNGECDPEPEITEVGDDVELRRYVGCAEGVGVELYSIDGGGHTWPGSEIIIGPAEMTTDTIDATALALDWFEAHPRTS